MWNSVRERERDFLIHMHSMALRMFLTSYFPLSRSFPIHSIKSSQIVSSVFSKYLMVIRFQHWLRTQMNAQWLCCRFVFYLEDNDSRYQNETTSTDFFNTSHLLSFAHLLFGIHSRKWNKNEKIFILRFNDGQWRWQWRRIVLAVNSLQWKSFAIFFGRFFSIYIATNSIK